MSAQGLFYEHLFLGGWGWGAGQKATSKVSFPSFSPLGSRSLSSLTSLTHLWITVWIFPCWKDPVLSNRQVRSTAWGKAQRQGWEAGTERLRPAWLEMNACWHKTRHDLEELPRGRHSHVRATDPSNTACVFVYRFFRDGGKPTMSFSMHPQLQVDLYTGTDEDPGIAFHFRVYFGYVMMNSRDSGGCKYEVTSLHTPFQDGQPFELWIFVHPNEYQVIVMADTCIAFLIDLTQDTWRWCKCQEMFPRPQCVPVSEGYD